MFSQMWTTLLTDNLCASVYKNIIITYTRRTMWSKRSYCSCNWSEFVYMCKTTEYCRVVYTVLLLFFCSCWRVPTSSLAVIDVWNNGLCNYRELNIDILELWNSSWLKCDMEWNVVIVKAIVYVFLIVKLVSCIHWI